MAKKKVPTKTSERSHKELTKAQKDKFYDDLYGEDMRNYIKSLPTEKEKEEVILEEGINYLRRILGPGRSPQSARKKKMREKESIEQYERSTKKQRGP